MGGNGLAEGGGYAPYPPPMSEILVYKYRSHYRDKNQIFGIDKLISECILATMYGVLLYCEEPAVVVGLMIRKAWYSGWCSAATNCEAVRLMVAR